MKAGDLRDHFQAMSEVLARQVEQGYAPWMRSFDGAETPLPLSLGTDSRARDIASVWLAAVAVDRGWRDPRWGTFQTIRARGGTVRRGERATLVPARHPTRRRLEPFRVFNAQQCRGLEEWVPEPARLYWGLQLERAERALRHSGAAIVESSHPYARYDPRADRIELPPKEAFGHAADYLRTAVHELGHWTGHPDRLDRETLRRGMAEGFGSEEWAREELRAEIASMLVGDRLELGHDPTRHRVHGGTWARILRTRPLEIAAAAQQAEVICHCVQALQRGRTPAWPRQREASRESPLPERSDERSR